MDKNVEQLVASCQGLVRSIAWKIHRQVPTHVELDDLIAYGNLGLTQAARDFDPNRGSKFTTYAYYRVRGAVVDGLRQMSWFKISDYHRGTYGDLSQDLVATENEVESPGDVPGEAGWVRGVCGRLAIVQLLCQGGEGDRVEDESAQSPCETAVLRETFQKLRELVDELPPPADDLIRSTYYEGMTLKEAGERLGRSKAWASRLHAKALSRLERGLRSLALC